jgi:hypothetical protein
MADSYDVELLGQPKLIQALIAAGRFAPQALGQALYEEGSMAFKQSQKEVPVRKGYLKNSGRITLEQAGGDVEVTITYGSAAADYAAPVHDLNKNYRNGRKWHYVADPVKARTNGMDQRLAKRINRSIEGMSG